MKRNADYQLGEKASVLFSGGSDSTLAAYLIAARTQHTTLLTFDPGFIFFVENSRRHAQILIDKLGPDRVEHKIIPIKPIIDRILFGDVKHDLRKYGFNLTALGCLGCRMSMHAAAVIFNLENNIPVIADGSITKQADIPEQMDSFIRRNREQLWRRYGMRHYSPIYNVVNSDRRLDDLGLSAVGKLKHQFILFDTQPTCPIGVPADVYARLFYGHLSGPAREVDMVEYSEEKYPAMHRLIEDHFEGKKPTLAQSVRKLQRAAAKLPETWEEVTDD